MKEIGIYTSIAISILGIAYPILLQVISTLDEKYSSIQIVDLFDKEREKKGFQYLLISSLISLVLWSFQWPPLISIKAIDFIIGQSAAYLLILSSILLVIFFFLLVNKIFIYLTPIKFVTYLIKRHKKNIGELKYFKALTDVFLKSIQEQNHNLSETISRFLYEDFKQQRVKFKDAPVEYPDAYYSLVYKSIEELAILKDKKNTALEYRTAGGIWLLGETGGFEISEKTYNWLWYNILLAVKYEQDDMILYHWERAHQYIKFALRHLQPEYNQQFDVTNQGKIEKRKKERERFLDFHYALGGLLLYKRRYACIKRMFDYTTSEPPSYDLLPGTMSEIFTNYMRYRDVYNNHWISRLYPFPEMEGIKSDNLIVRWISSYLALLLLRQYSIHPYLTTMTPLQHPPLPKGQAAKSTWINNLEFMKRLISEHLENEELIDSVKFKFITQDWCSKEGKTYPLDFIDQLRSELKEKYKQDAFNIELSEEKKNQFFSVSQKIIENQLDLFIAITNPQDAVGDINRWYINGQRMVQSKDTFAEESEVHHIDFDSFLAFDIANEISNGISLTFISSRSKHYLLKAKDLFPAIDKLGATNEYVIVSFGIDLSNTVNYGDIKGFNGNKYKGISYLNLPNCPILYDTIFILKRDELPVIKTLPLDEELITKYSLTSKSDKFNLYMSVLDLNLVTDEVRLEMSHLKSDEELRMSVLLIILFSIEISWSKNVGLIQLTEYSEYSQHGTPNSLSDIAPI